MNFYIGNNADSKTTLAARPGWEWEDIVEMPLRTGIEKHSERSDYFFEQAWQFMAAEPVAYLGLLAQKTYAFWHGDEIGRNQAIYYWRNYSAVLSATLWKWAFVAFPFGLLSPLSLTGIALAVRKRGVDMPLLFVAVYSVSVIAFFPTARYRMPVVPLLAIYAVYVVAFCGGFARAGDWRAGGAVAAAWGLVALGGALNFGLPPMDMEGDALIHYHLGNAHLKDREAAAAIESFERSIGIDAQFWQAWINLGSAYAIADRTKRAIEIFEDVQEHHPNRFGVWINLAHAYRATGQTDEALHAYERALEKGRMVRAYREYISYCIELLDFGRAWDALDSAVTTFPDESEELRRYHDWLLRRARNKGLWE